MVVMMVGTVVLRIVVMLIPMEVVVVRRTVIASMVMVTVTVMGRKEILFI